MSHAEENHDEPARSTDIGDGNADDADARGLSSLPTASETPATKEKVDPYILTEDKILEPPKTIGESLKFLGPGMITSAAVVGSGELITATTLGAQVGFMLLWLVFVSTFVKVAVQIELARWSISTGKPAIFGYDDVPPRIFGHGWPSYIVLALGLQYLISQAGVIGSAAVAASMLVPIGGDPYSALSISVWVWIMIVVAIVLHQANKYELIEKLSTVLVVIVTVLVVVMVFAIQATEFAWTLGDLGDGMRFRIAAGSMGVALAMFGLTGVGAGEMTGYSFWVVEKGYAAYSGPNDGSQAWVDRANGWIKVMKMDAWVSWFVYTISTAAFYILGAAVLHPQSLVPEGNQLIEVISNIFTDTLGEWVGPFFLLFAAIALYKTIIANIPTFARAFAGSLSVFKLFTWTDTKKRDRVMRILMIILPLTWAILATVAQSPLQLVILGGILNAIYLMIVAVATLYLSATQTDKRLHDGVPWKIYLVISAISIFALGLISLF